MTPKPLKKYLTGPLARVTRFAALLALAGCAGAPKLEGPQLPPAEQPVAQAPAAKEPGLVFRSPGKIKIFSHSETNWRYRDLPAGLDAGDRIRVAPDSGFAEIYLHRNILIRLGAASTLGIISTAPAAFELIAGQVEIWNNSGAGLSIISEGAAITAGNGTLLARITGKNSIEAWAYKNSITVKKDASTQLVPEMKKLFLSAEGAFYLSPIGRFNKIPPMPEPDAQLVRQVDSLFAPER
ncbi:MAG: hypothetical protein PHW69_03710 [Elusimicrobiaceae bacterium]|nr:hypothetical protein [Elusimicrobiaceae bacterium]